MAAPPALIPCKSSKKAKQRQGFHRITLLFRTSQNGFQADCYNKCVNMEHWTGAESAAASPTCCLQTSCAASDLCQETILHCSATAPLSMAKHPASQPFDSQPFQKQHRFRPKIDMIFAKDICNLCRKYMQSLGKIDALVNRVA